MVVIAALLFLASTFPVLEDLIAKPIDKASEKRAEKPTNEQSTDENENALCRQDLRLCFEVIKNQDTEASDVIITQNDKSVTYSLSEEGDRGLRSAWFKLWPKIIQAKIQVGSSVQDVTLFGVIQGLSEMYSGGGAHSEILTLYRFAQTPNDKEQAGVEPMLSIPVLGNIMIRACFSEKDQYLRRGICHDFYDFKGDLTLSTKSLPVGYPEFTFKTNATALPGTSRRSKDNTSGRKRLSKAAAKPVVDPACTYTRTARFDPQKGQYEFDKPLPDCSDYTVP